MAIANDVLGRLGELGEEMEKVVEELQRQQLSLNGQQRILSRMLDAQKIGSRKGTFQKRQAEREQVLLQKSPPQLERKFERGKSAPQEMQEALKKKVIRPRYKDCKLYYEISHGRAKTAGAQRNN